MKRGGGGHRKRRRRTENGIIGGGVVELKSGRTGRLTSEMEKYDVIDGKV